MRGKRGQGLSTNTVILLVLGLLVLAALAYGFFTGFEALRGTVEKNNVDDIVTQCSSQCAMASKYDFCAAPKVLVDAEGEKVKASCKVLANEPTMASYGIKDCPAIECSNTCASLKVNDVQGRIVSSVQDADFDITNAVNDVPAGSYCIVPSN